MKINRILLDSTVAAAILLGAVNAFAESGEQAESLYENNCLSCHGSEIYTRDERMVASLDGLERQVQRCETALGLRWFDDDIKDVAAYLNDRFYKFER
jgi:cytochrome c553